MLDNRKILEAISDEFKDSHVVPGRQKSTLIIKQVIGESVVTIHNKRSHHFIVYQYNEYMSTSNYCFVYKPSSLRECRYIDLHDPNSVNELKICVNQANKFIIRDIFFVLMIVFVTSTAIMLFMLFLPILAIISQIVVILIILYIIS